MEETQIIIVGNGFDVNHGIPSSYAHFKTWLSNNDKELFDFLERYIDVAGDWWNDFERSLSEIDIPKLIRETPLEDKPVNPRIPPSFSHPACWRLDSVRDAISLKFTEWVKTLDGVEINKKIDLPEACLYISFNYTDTLEILYGIEDVLHIHGDVGKNDILIIGHGDTRDIERAKELYNGKIVTYMGVISSIEDNRIFSAYYTPNGLYKYVEGLDGAYSLMRVELPYNSLSNLNKSDIISCVGTLKVDSFLSINDAFLIDDSLNKYEH